MSPIRILLVEDERITAMDECALLEEMGYEVIASVASGQDAVDKAITDKPDIILMDIMLDGDMDGIDAAETIRQIQDIPIIFVSAHSDSEFLQRAKISGSVGYVLKPFNRESLSINIEMALYKHDLNYQLQQNQKFLQEVTSVLTEGLIVIDTEGHTVFMNPEAENLLGRTKEEINQQGLHLHSVIHQHPEKKGESKNNCPIVQVFETKIPQRIADDNFINMQGKSFPVSYSAVPMQLPEGGMAVVIAFQDITEGKKVLEKLEQVATHDALTQLFNRGSLISQLSEEISRTQRYARPLSIFMLDIDYFKKVNDQFGHQAGDKVLQHIARQLGDIVRKTDIVARYGGEEFVIVLPETSHEKALELAERLCTMIASIQVDITNKQTLKITLSIGVASYPNHAYGQEQLLNSADEAMYEAKRAGRNQVKSATINQ